MATASCSLVCLTGVRITLIMSWNRERGGWRNEDGEDVTKRVLTTDIDAAVLTGLEYALQVTLVSRWQAETGRVMMKSLFFSFSLVKHNVFVISLLF